MATKATKPVKIKDSKAALAIKAKRSSPADREMLQEFAKIVLRPSVNAAAVVSEYTKPFGDQDFCALTAALGERMEEDLESGDLLRCEAMLYGQAHALQSIFMTLARRATTQEYLKQWDATLRMALKAQNQCRMTLETLATIKNPPVVFARQANIAHGPQQVNNGVAAEPSRAEETKIQANKVLEPEHGERLDLRAAGAAGSVDSAVEALGTIQRA